MRGTVLNKATGLQPGEVHIHLLRLEKEGLAERARDLLTLLPSEERMDHLDLAGTGRQAEFLASRALIRQVLAFYSGEDPRKLRFGRQAAGKPYLDGSELQFSLSHTEGLQACSVGLRKVGVDVEKRETPAADWERVARRFFSPVEQDYLFTQDKDLQPHLFLQIFTLKEAAVKADGRGLSLPWAGFSVPLPGRDRPAGPWDYFTRYLEGEKAWLAHVTENPTDKPLDHRVWVWEPDSLLKLPQDLLRRAEGTHGHFRR